VQFSPSLSQEEKIEYYRGAVRRYVAALNGKDLDAILALYAENAVVQDPVFQREFRGKQALREFYAQVITRAQLEITGPIRGSYGNVTATPIKARIPGVEIDVISLTTFDDDGLVSLYTAYWGPSDSHAVAG
jgi:steroid delta-isomerase